MGRAWLVLLGGLMVAACSSETGPTQPPVVAHVTFTSQPPASVEGNVILTPAVEVTIRDSNGDLVPRGTVTLGIGTVPWPAPGPRLSGTLTVSAHNGVATFADLRVDKPGSGYTLVATSGAVHASSSPFDVKVTFTDVAAGGLHTCGLTSGGVYCWGADTYGQLGGATGAVIADSVPVLVPSLLQFIQVAGGEEHTCALSRGGVAFCWGHNDQSQLGDGTRNGPDQCPGAQTLLVQCDTAPAQVAGSGVSPLAFASISSGPLALHTCSLTAGGTAYCWGYNYSGQIGDNTTTNRPAPTQVVGAGTAPLVFTALSAGGVHTCGVTADNALYCWGYNAFGELGDGTLTDRYTPAQVTGSGSAPLRFTAVTARRLHSCGLTTDGAVYCWGSNALGELGDGSTTGENTPVLVTGSGTPPLVFTSIGGGDIHTCGVTTVGALYCWGFNHNGQLGDSTTTNSATPVHVRGSGIGPLVFTAVAAGEGHTCGLTMGHTVYCWGFGADGELGNGARTSQVTPVPIVQ